MLTSISASAEVIELSKSLKVKNPDIIAAANKHMHWGIYWEDEGYEYKMLEDADDVYITTIYKDQNGETEKLGLSASVRSGGFGWYAGYKEGWSNCFIELEKNEDGTWKNAEGFAECETEFDWD
jgi:hypothetical protein